MIELTHEHRAVVEERDRLRAWLVYLDEATEDDNLRAAIALALKGEAPDPIGGQ
jgi:hypothetical protein